MVFWKKLNYKFKEVLVICITFYSTFLMSSRFFISLFVTFYTFFLRFSILVVRVTLLIIAIIFYRTHLLFFKSFLMVYFKYDSYFKYLDLTSIVYQQLNRWQIKIKISEHSIYPWLKGITKSFVYICWVYKYI